MTSAAHKQFGRYELVHEIGRGGMAELWLGRLIGVRGFAKPVAIKRILPHLAVEPRFAQMFINEGTIAARLSHPNICQVIELGEVAGELYLAMEYLEGVSWGDLSYALVKDPMAMVRLATTVFGQACDGLAYAHELTEAGKPTPVVHRDISPGNLFVTVDGITKVLDFGVSKIATENHETRSGMIKGKLPYMPPEQIRGEDVDSRADVFALGVCLWEAVTGERLFLRGNDYLIFKAIIEEPIPSVLKHAPELGKTGEMLDAMLARALERDRTKRYGSIRSFGEDLRSIAATIGGPVAQAEVGSLVRQTFQSRLAERSRVVESITGLPPASGPTKVAPLPAAEPSVDAPPPRRSRMPLVIGAIGVLALAAVGVTLLSRSDDRDTAGPPVMVATVHHDDAAATPDAAVDAAADAPAPDAGSEQGSGAGSDDGEITLDPVDAQRPATTPRPRPTNTQSPPQAGKGYFSIDSRPYATIFVDGKKLDQTPIFRVALPAGRHTIRARLADGRQKSFTINIEPDKDVRSGTLTW